MTARCVILPLKFVRLVLCLIGGKHRNEWARKTFDAAATEDSLSLPLSPHVSL